MTITTTTNGTTIITPSTSSPSSSPSLARRRIQQQQPHRSNSSGDLKKAAAAGKGRRRSSDHASPSTIGSTLKKASANRHHGQARAGGKSQDKKSKKAAGFEAWANARLTTSPVPSSKASSSSPVFMPTVVAPVWQPSENILSLVHQADESPRLPPVVVAVSSSAPSSPSLSSSCVARIPCPPSFDHISTSFEPLSTTCTPPCSPASYEEAPVVAPVPVPVEVVEVAAEVAPVVRQAVHEDFEIETSRVSCVVPTMVTVVSQQDDIIHTSDPVSSPIVAAAASYMGRTAAIRTLIIALVALAALGAVMYTSSMSHMSSMGMGMSAAAVPSVMLLAAFINRSSSPSSFVDDANSNNGCNSSSGDTMTSLSTSVLAKHINGQSNTMNAERSSSHKGNRRSSRRRASAH